MDEFELYHKRCRLCASDHRLGISIFGPEGVALDLMFKIKTYLSMDVSLEDELPKQVCYQCLYRIETFHNFKQTCIESEHTLRNWHLFYGGFSEKEDSVTEDDADNSSRISVESVAQPTTSSLSKMAEKAINTQKNKMKKHLEADTSAVESADKIEVVAAKNGRNLRHKQEKTERIFLNMSGVGTISVTKFEGRRLQEMSIVSKEEELDEEDEEIVIETHSDSNVVKSDDEDESDGFSGFAFNETVTLDSGDEIVKGEAEEMLMAEFIPNECVQFEHLEVDQNGEVQTTESMSASEVTSEPEDPLKYMMVTLDGAGGPRYACMKCNKTFAQKSYVKEHMKIHTGEKPYSCTECGRSFRNNYMLKVHFRLHTGEKNFKCEECGALFTERGALVSHSRTHTGAKPFSCTFCERKFSQNPALKRHLRIHTKEKPYMCEHCDSSFADRGTWRNHMRTHTGERPYECTLCGKSFVQRTNLQAHIKTHTDERPFPCQVCSASFRTKAHLVKHLSTIHREVMKSVVTYMKPKSTRLPESFIST